MPRSGCAAASRIVGALLTCGLAVTGCSGTVEASYRPPPPAPPSPTAAPAPATPTPGPSIVPALNCGPDRVLVQVGDVQTDATSRAVPLMIRGNGPVPCGVANPVGVTLLDATGQELTTRIEATELPDGRSSVDRFTADRSVMVWLQWRPAPSIREADPATDCVEGQSLLLSLTRGADPIPVPATIRACDGGTVYVSPAEANVG
jgi:hypothetical protein